MVKGRQLQTTITADIPCGTMPSRNRKTPCAQNDSQDAAQVRRTRICGATRLTYGTGIIVQAAMAEASAREYAAQCGLNE
jgi:hypothetical protein